MLVLSSPSGAGKTSICKKVISLDRKISLSVSYTTRPKRKSEKEGKDYFFVSKEKFEDLKKKSFFIEFASVFDHWYGTPKDFIEKNLNNGQDVIFDIDWQGAQKLSDFSKNDVVSIFILPPSIEELESRLKLRNQDSDDEISSRMAKSVEEISHWPEYDYVVVNDDIDQTEEKLKIIITAERLRLSQQPGILEFVRGLNSEFGDR